MKMIVRKQKHSKINNIKQVARKKTSHNKDSRIGTPQLFEPTIIEEPSFFPKQNKDNHHNAISPHTRNLDAADNFFTESFPYEKNTFSSLPKGSQKTTKAAQCWLKNLRLCRF